MGRYDRGDYRRGRSGGRGYAERDLGGEPDPFTGWYPGAYWAGAPMFGWGGMAGWGWPPYVPVGVGRDPAEYTPRRDPRESATYGRGGDEAARRWAERYGYDIEYSIRPRGGGRAGGPADRGRAAGGSGGGRYDRGWSGGGTYAGPGSGGRGRYDRDWRGGRNAGW